MNELSNLSKKDLQEIAKALKQKCSGNKNELCNRISGVLGLSGNQIGGMKEADKAAYFLEGTPLDDKQKSYCRCILHTASKQPEWCLKEKAWRQTRGGQGCYNPYAICTKSVQRSGPAFECAKYYDLDHIPSTELTGLANLKGKSVQELRSSLEEERDF